MKNTINIQCQCGSRLKGTLPVKCEKCGLEIKSMEVKK